MTRCVSVFLLLVVALGAGSELAWAQEGSEIRVEAMGVDVLPTQEVEDVESSDELVSDASWSVMLGAPASLLAPDRRIVSAPDGPPTRPPRG